VVEQQQPLSDATLQAAPECTFSLKLPLAIVWLTVGGMLLNQFYWRHVQGAAPPAFNAVQAALLYTSSAA
jgi:hypothetical protein